jgi:acetolactate synthase-1/2/3 large subunit
MLAARAAILERLAIRSGGPLTPQHVIDAAVRAAAPDSRISVDAGAHMLPVMAFWQAARPMDVLISNGLATMGFALPAAIAAALESPQRRVLAFAGDGGLMMCAGELATAAQQRCRLTVVVLNDSALSMIGVKQKRSGYRARGVDFAPADFSQVARGFGLRAWRASTPDEYARALAEALDADGPTLIDAAIDPSGYLEQVKALRG